MKLGLKGRLNPEWLWIVGAIVLGLIFAVISHTHKREPPRPAKSFEQSIRDGDI